MCGIGGVARLDGAMLDGSADVLLNALADVLAHRGPDDRELLRDGPMGLAFTRLSLTDPVGGGQPLRTRDGDVTLIANGEIYNHRELAASLPAGTRMTTGSDCEVLLYLYQQHGLQFLDRVRGMFSLMLWDRRANQLILARDRFGIKSLFFHRDDQRIVMGSEIKALFADPRTPRRLAWERALTTPALAAAPYFADGPTATWFEGVEVVPAGTILRIDLAGGRTEEHRYWSFPGERPDLPGTAEQFVDEYRSLLADSVRECATADAELGIFLSGGIDSSVVAALAADHAGELHTFTVLNASTYRNEDAEFGHRVAGKLGLPNHQVLLTEARTPEPDEWRRLLWLAETPFCGPEIFYKHELHRYAKDARPELRGMLLGAASDEFNGGYSTDMAGGGGWSSFQDNLLSMTREPVLRARPDLAPWWLEGADSLITDEAVRQFAGASLEDPYRTYLNWEYRKIQQYNVWHEDRTAAGSGIEARVPFLDHRLVELVTAVPRRLRPELLWDKQILRRGVRGLLPDDVVERPKRNFFYGSGQRHTYRMLLRMLGRNGGELVEQALSAPGAAEFINAASLRRSLQRSRQEQDREQLELALRVINLGLLSGMVADLPEPTVRTAPGPVPLSLPVSQWDVERSAIEQAVGLRPDVAGEDVFDLAEDVLVLNRPAEPQRWYVILRGSVEYVVDDEEPLYRGILLRVDGVRTLASVAAELHTEVAELSSTVVELQELNLIVKK